MIISVFRRHISDPIVQALLVFGAFGLLLLSWLFISLMLLASTEGWLAPWDTKPFEPPPNTWEYVFNNFFESGLGSLLPTIFFVGASIVLYIRGRQCFPHNTHRLTWQYAFSNLAFILVTISVTPWALQLGKVGSMEVQQLSYTLFLPAILLTIVSLSCWLALQFIFNRYPKL